MIEQQYYTSSEIGGVNGTQGYCTIACSSGLNIDILNVIDNGINSTLSPSEHGGFDYQYMYSDNRMIILGHSETILGGRYAFFVHNYILPSGSEEWINTVKKPDNLVYLRFVQPFVHKKQIPQLDQIDEMPVDSADSQYCTITSLLDAVGISKKGYVGLLSDVMEQISNRAFGGVPSTVVAVLSGEREDEQRTNAKKLIKAVLLGLPYGARRFFGYSFLYHGGSLTPSCILTVVERSRISFANKFSQTVYDFSQSADGGKKIDLTLLPLYIRKIYESMDAPTSITEFIDDLEYITTVNNCHYQAMPDYLAAVIIEQKGIENIFSGVTRYEIEKALSLLEQQGSHSDQRNTMLMLNVLLYYLRDSLANNISPDDILFSKCFNRLQQNGCQTSCSEILELIEEVYRLTPPVSYILNWFAVSPYADLFFSKLAMINPALLQEYYSRGLQCDRIPELIILSDKLLKNTNGEQNRSLLIKSTCNRAIEIFNALDYLEREYILKWLDNEVCNSVGVVNKVYQTILNNCYTIGKNGASIDVSEEELILISTLKNAIERYSTAIPYIKVLAATGELLFWYRNDHTIIFQHLSDLRGDKYFYVIRNVSVGLIKESLQNRKYTLHLFLLVWHYFLDFLPDSELTAEIVKKMLICIKSLGEKTLIQYIEWCIRKRLLPNEFCIKNVIFHMGGIILKSEKKGPYCDDREALKKYSVFLNGLLSFMVMDFQYFSDSKRRKKIIDAVASNSFTDRYFMFIDAVNKVFFGGRM